MGLDICHVILSAKDEHTPEYFYLEELEDFPGFVGNHKTLITEVIETDVFFTVYIFPEESSKNRYAGRFEYNRHQALLVGNIEELADAISAIEHSNSLSPTDKLVTEDSVDMTWTHDAISFTTIKYPIGDIIEKVIYWKTIGYQRKQMSRRFYEDFDNCKLYFRKSDVLKAATYLSADRENLPALNDSFKADFIDNFVEGKSIFFGSW
jgi:hypothetical protein